MGLLAPLPHSLSLSVAHVFEYCPLSVVGPGWSSESAAEVVRCQEKAANAMPAIVTQSAFQFDPTVMGELSCKDLTYNTTRQVTRTLPWVLRDQPEHDRNG